METNNSYCRRRFWWTTSATLAQIRRWSWIVDLAAVPFIGYALLKIFDYFSFGSRSTSHFLDWLALVPELGMWSILYTIPSGIIAVLVHWAFNWFRAPGKLDEQLRGEFEKAVQEVREGARDLDLKHKSENESLRNTNEHLREKVENFEKRLRPDIWIKETVFTKDTVIMAIADEVLTGKTTRVGFTIENRGYNGLSEVQVTLERLQIFDFIQSKKVDFPEVNPPILLEWDPQEQESGGKSITTIPAGSSRRIGLFENHYIRAANTKVKKSVTIDTNVYRREYYVILRVSAAGISAADSSEYTIIYTTASAPPEDGSGYPVDVEPKGYRQLYQERYEEMGGQTCR